MSVITFPTTLTVRSMRWEQQRNDTEYRSVFGAQAIEVSAPLWAVSLVGKQTEDSNAGEFKALLLSLKGRVNQLELWDQMRPAPIGSMRGAMTFNAGAAVGDITLAIVAAGQAAKTLLKGDLLGFGTGITQQVVMVMADATSDGAGIISVTVQPPLRNAFLAAAAIIWDKPKALFRQSGSNMRNGWDYSEMLTAGFNLDLLEDWRP